MRRLQKSLAKKEKLINELNVYLNSKEKELAACYANLRKAALLISKQS